MILSLDRSKLIFVTQFDINEHGQLKTAIPGSVTHIGDGAFEYCANLSSITIPYLVTQIGFVAFWGCTSLTSITIPNSVTQIRHDAFDGCATSLTNIIIDSDDKEVARITVLLPKKLRSKVVNKHLCKQAQNIHKTPLCRITNEPKTTKAGYLNHPKNNDDIVRHIGSYLENDYADNARQEMQGLIIPTDGNWDEYTKEVNNIADKHISKARVDHTKKMSAILTKKHEAEEAPHLYPVTAIPAPIANNVTFFAKPGSTTADVVSQSEVDTSADEEPAAHYFPCCCLTWK